MNDRFRFRIPITNLDGQFDRFIFCDVYHEPIHFIGSAIFLTPEQCTGLKDKNGYALSVSVEDCLTFNQAIAQANKKVEELENANKQRT